MIPVEHERESIRFEMENTTSGLRTELDNLKALLDQTLKDSEGVRKRLTAANAELEELRNRETKLKCDLENAQQTKASAGSEAEQLRQELAELKGRLAEADRGKTKLERELEKVTDRCRSLEQKLTHSETLLSKEKEVGETAFRKCVYIYTYTDPYDSYTGFTG